MALTEIKVVREDEKATKILKAIRQIDDGAELYTIEEIAQKICDSYKYCKEGECPGFAYCRHEGTGTLAWLKKVLNSD